MKKKTIVGIILLVLWGIYFILLLVVGSEDIGVNAFLFYLIGIFSLPGYLCLYYGLSLRNRGIMLFITGILLILPCVIFSIVIIINPFFPWWDLIIAIYIMFIVKWILLFIAPSIYMIFTSATEYNTQVPRYYLLAIACTLVGMWFFLGIGGLLVTNAGGDFRSFFFQNIWISIPIGFVIGPIIVAIAYSLRRHRRLIS